MSLEFRRIVRRLAGCKWSACPVRIVDGNVAPRICGEGFYWTTPSGKTIIRHPSAYKWPKRYHASTRRVEVGREFLATLAGPIVSAESSSHVLTVDPIAAARESIRAVEADPALRRSVQAVCAAAGVIW